MDKSLELKYLMEVEKIYRDFPEGNLLCSERPDFLLESQDGIIGLEITRLIRKQNNSEIEDRGIEAEQRKVLNIAKTKFEKKCRMPLFVSVSWRYHNNLSRKLINLLADELVKIVESYIPEEIFEQVVIKNNDLFSFNLENYCYSIFIIRQQKSACWVSENPASPPLLPSEVEEKITQKIQKLGNYNEDCNEIWLILVFEGIDSGSLGDTGESVLNYNFKSPYDKILLYDRVERLVHLLINKKRDKNI
jgi:hypothetical protein